MDSETALCFLRWKHGGNKQVIFGVLARLYYRSMREVEHAKEIAEEHLEQTTGLVSARGSMVEVSVRAFLQMVLQYRI